MRGVQLLAVVFSKGLDCFDKSQRQEEKDERQSQGCCDRPGVQPFAGPEKMLLAPQGRGWA